VAFWGVVVLLGTPAAICADTEDPSSSQILPIEEFALENGMKFLLVHRPEVTTVSAGWVVSVGSANDTSGKSGMSHLLEHLLFKGSQTIGAKDTEKELAVLDRQDEIQLEIAEARDAVATASDRKAQKWSRQILALESQMLTLQEQARSLTFLGQFSFFYSELGATGLNANTYPDMTIYFVNIPTNRLEGWFWMESDRLLQPVFRELYKEIEVVHEERRLRIESDPIGILEEQVRLLVWGSHPYALGPQGRPEEVDRLSRPAARDFFEQHYRPENLTAALVGGFDPEQVKSWARTYFGRLPSTEQVLDTQQSRKVAPPPNLEERRFEANCDCTPQARVHYPSVAFGHPDAYSLDVLAGVLSGRTGRLFRSLVLDQEIAFSAYARQRTWKQAGQFSFFGETKGDALPADLVKAWDIEVARLRTEPASDNEIQRTINRLSADAFRSLKDPAALMSQLLYYEGLGDWRHVSEWPRGIRSVSAADVQRVAKQYLDPEARTIALYRRQTSARKSDSANLRTARESTP